MLFRRDILQGIAEGRVTLAFRRWRRAPPADGSSLRSPVGVLSFNRITVVDEGDITAEDVRRTGMSPDELRATIGGEGTLLRIELRLDARKIHFAHAARREQANNLQTAELDTPAWRAHDGRIMPPVTRTVHESRDAAASSSVAPRGSIVRGSTGS